jgi:ribA/ribD-fused uncharacterized protein
MSVNKNLSNVFEQMYQIVEDRQNGVRMTDSVVVFDDHLHPLSVGYQCNIRLESIDFPSADHAQLYLRAMAFQDRTAMSQIARANTIQQARAVTIQRFSNNLWRKFEHRSMLVVNSAKIQQNESIRSTLKMTGSKRLVYASKRDTYFGCGLNMNDDNILYPQFWLGQNQLGHILDQVRKSN